MRSALITGITEQVGAYLAEFLFDADIIIADKSSRNE